MLKLTEEHAFEMAEAQSQIESLLERVNELELQARTGREDFQSENMELAEQLKELE